MRLQAGIDKDEISESRRGIDLKDIAASMIGAYMDILSLGHLRDGIDEEETSESKRGINPMEISASKIGADMDMLSVRHLRTGSINQEEASIPWTSLLQ